jgi:hypothetical protein
MRVNLKAWRIRDGVFLAPKERNVYRKKLQEAKKTP